MSLTIDVTSLPAPTRSSAALPGDTVNFQFWHRDASGNQVTSNFSPGLELSFDSAAPTFEQDVWPMLSQPNTNAPDASSATAASAG